VEDELRRGVLVALELQGTPLDMLWQLSSLTAERRVPAASLLRRYIAQPDATRTILARSAGHTGSRFRPPVHVTIWT
jgi:hypothetical protein